MPRPKKKVDLDKLHTLSMIGCSLEVIASQLNVSHDTLQRRYHAEIEAGRASGKKSVLGKAYQLAMRGNGRMLELLLVNWCGFSLHPSTVVNVTQNATAPQLSFAEFKRQVAEAEIFANAIFDGQHEQLTDGDRGGSPEIPT